jgi:hypothetical protein
LVTVNVTEALDPCDVVTDSAYSPGVMSAVAISQGGVALRHGGFVCMGMAKTIVPFVEGTFEKALPPKLIVFIVLLKPEPEIVTRIPTGPVSGCTAVIAGADEGATPFAVHPDRMMTPRHTPKLGARRPPP